MGLMRVLFLGGIESTAGLTGERVQAPRRAPGPAQAAARRPVPHPGRGGGGGALVHAAPARWPHDVARGHSARRDDPRRRPRRPGLRLREPRRAPVRRPGRLPRHARHVPPPRVRRGAPRLPRRAAGSPRAQDRARGGAARSSASTTLAGDAVRYQTTPNMYVWNNLPLSFAPQAAAARVTTVRGAPRSRPVVDRKDRRSPTASSASSSGRRTAARCRRWHPGAHVDLMIDGHADPAVLALRRPRRPVHLPDRDPARAAGGAGGSRSSHDELAEGDLVAIGGPRNHFRFVPAPRYLFIAGGIGITPMLPMVAAAAGRRRRLAAHLRRSAAVLDGVPRRACRVRRPRPVRPQDETGLLDLDVDPRAPRGRHARLRLRPRARCSRPSRTRMAAWPHGALHLERFAPKPLAEPERADAFEVVLAQSGRTLIVPPGRSILSIVEEAGVRRPLLVRERDVRHLRHAASSRASPTTATRCSRRTSRR